MRTEKYSGLTLMICNVHISQALSVVISSELGKQSVNIIEDTKEVSNIYVDCFSDSQVGLLMLFIIDQHSFSRCRRVEYVVAKREIVHIGLFILFRRNVF